MDTPTPIIRLELEHMKHSIIHAMGVHFVEMDEAVQRAIKRAIDNFDYGGEIEKLAHRIIQQALDDALRKHFRPGGEGYQDIQKVAVKIIETRLAVAAE